MAAPGPCLLPPEGLTMVWHFRPHSTFPHFEISLWLQQVGRTGSLHLPFHFQEPGTQRATWLAEAQGHSWNCVQVSRPKSRASTHYISCI